MDNLESTYDPVLPSSPTPSLVQKPQKTLIFILVIILLAGASAAGVWAYNRYAVPPEKQILNAVEKMTRANSFAYTGSISVTVTPTAAYGQYLEMAVPQIGESKSQKIDINFSGAWEGKTKETNKWLLSFLVSMATQKDLAIGLEMRSIHNTFYAKVSDTTKIPFDVSAYTNQWIKLDIGGYLEQFGLKTVPLATGTVSGNKETLSEIRDQKIKEMVVGAHVLKINKVSTKKIDGESYRVYNVTVQKENLKKLVLDIAAFEETRVTEKQLESFNKNLEELKDASGDIVIGKKDGFLYELHFNLASTKGEHAMFAVSFKDFNKPVTVTEPENAMSVEELIGSFFGSLDMGAGFGGSSMSDNIFQEAALDKSIQMQTDSDKDGLVDYLEAQYGANPLKADTDSDGFSDFEEVKNGYNPNGAGKISGGFSKEF